MLSKKKLRLLIHIALAIATSIFSATTYAATALIYHHVSTTMPASTSISPERFNAQMDYLATNNFNIVPLNELVDKLRKREPLPDKTIAITFDDAYGDVYSAAYPILKKRGWPFTFFVNTDAVDSGKLFVTWDQLREMSKNGVTIANHTPRHNHVVRLEAGETLAQWRTRFTDDINKSQAKIEQEIGTASKIFAYPYGEYNAEAKKILEKLDYVAFTQQAGVLYPQGDLQILPRFAFGGSFTEMPDFIQKTNALPLPVKSAEFYADKNHKLDDNVVKAGSKPYAVLTFADNSILQKTNCYANSERITTEVVDDKLWVQTIKPLPQGRTKITCTAASQERGRYYWFTQLWLVTDAKGNWSYQD